LAEPAFDHMATAFTAAQRQWPPVGDVFQRIVDIAHDERAAARGGASISKAIDLCEQDRGGVGRSQLARLWSRYCDVGHLIAAAAWLAEKRLSPRDPHAGSILMAVCLAPEAVIGLASGLEEFGLHLVPLRQKLPVLRPDTVWRIPAALAPRPRYIVKRLLSEKQITFLNDRRARKKYIPMPSGKRG
jgi:hypothetical protein